MPRRKPGSCFCAGPKRADLVLSAFLSGLDEALGTEGRAFRSFVQSRDLSYKALCAVVVALGRDGRLPVAAEQRPEGDHPYGRAIALCLEFDGLTRDTQERAALRPDEALKTLLDDPKSSRDPNLVKLFANTLGIYPTGTVVLLLGSEPCCWSSSSGAGSSWGIRRGIVTRAFRRSWPPLSSSWSLLGPCSW